MGAPQPQETPIAFIAYTYSFYSLRPLMRLFLLIHALIRHGKILIQGRIDTSMSQLDSHTDGDYRNAAVPQLLNGPGPLLFVHNITAIQHDSIHLRSVRFFHMFLLPILVSKSYRNSGTLLEFSSSCNRRLEASI